MGDVPGEQLQKNESPVQETISPNSHFQYVPPKKPLPLLPFPPPLLPRNINSSRLLLARRPLSFFSRTGSCTGTFAVRRELSFEVRVFDFELGDECWERGECGRLAD